MWTGWWPGGTRALSDCALSVEVIWSSIGGNRWYWDEDFLSSHIRKRKTAAGGVCTACERSLTEGWLLLSMVGQKFFE